MAFRADSGAWLEKSIPVGVMPTDNDGAHGIAVSPDRHHWYLTIAHGTPNGTVWKFRAGADTLEGRASLGLFPATMSLSVDGRFLLAANFNLHGDPVASSVSVVHTPTMTELTKVPTCVMPHGSRITEDGRRQYSACMRSEQLVEIDLETLSVTRRFSVQPGREGPLDPADRGVDLAPAGAGPCSPTWAQPGRASRAAFVYVPCNRAGEVLEIDTRVWEISRRFPTGVGPYNLAATPDGSTLVVTLKGAQAVSLIDLERGAEAARVQTSEPVTHGVVVSDDGRYAFVSNESVGSTRGTLDVIDLRTHARVASLALAYQPGGIGFWQQLP